MAAGLRNTPEIDMTSQCIGVTMFLKRPGNGSVPRSLHLQRDKFNLDCKMFDEDGSQRLVVRTRLNMTK